MLNGILDRAKTDPVFAEIHRKFDEVKVETWLLEEEKLLHFAVGAYAAGDGRIVEIGSFKGGSACFLASGLAKRGRGRLTCVDPMLGAPPWLGTCPAQRTLDEFRRTTRECGVADWIDLQLGDSGAVAAVWPAEPIDAVFIDGDHSFLGALRDFECWRPKLNPGGLVLVDDADDTSLPELRDMIEFVKTLGSVHYLETVQGVAVFERNEMPAREMLSELSMACAGRQLYRSWDWSHLHRTGLPGNYLKSRSWEENDLDTGYQLGFLARCPAGPYGYSTASNPADRAILHALSSDRGDGEVIELAGVGAHSARTLKGRLWSILGASSQDPNAVARVPLTAGSPAARFRVIVCRPEEAKDLAPNLLPGGVLLARSSETGGSELQVSIRRVLVDAGLEGCGFGAGLHWGVWQPHRLAADTILNLAIAGAA